MDSQKDTVYKIKIADGDRVLVNTENFTYLPNGISILLGESGIGKTLIAKTIYGLLDPNELEIEINNQSYIEYLNSLFCKIIKRNSFFVFQEPSTHLNPLLKLQKQIREGSLQNSKKEKEILSDLWDHPVGLNFNNILEIYPKPYRPSGGEKQRILITMALKKIEYFHNNIHGASSSFFVFDEPSGSLDNHFRDIVLEKLLTLYRKQAFSILLITHDYSMISQIINTHKDLLPNIRFNELRLVEKTSILEEFSADRYLGWIRTQNTQKGTIPESTGKIVLKVTNQYSVFEQDFQIEKNGKPSDLIIREGEMAYVKAPSGVGKTTLAKIISGLIPAEKIKFSLDKYEVDEATPQKYWSKYLWGKKLGMVFQHADESLNLESTVFQVFKSLSHGRIPRQEIIKQLSQLFEFTISDEFLRKKVKYLSGGQKQRLNLLRTLILNTDLIILDEPLNGLDFDSCQRVINLIKSKLLHEKSVLMISHNEEIFDSIIPASQIFHLKVLKS